MTLCQLNGVGLFCTAFGDRVSWQACEALIEDGQPAKSRMGFGSTPEIAIADCKLHDFKELTMEAAK